MRWQGRRGSEQVEDRRAKTVRNVGIGGGIFGLLLMLVVYLLGGIPRAQINQWRVVADSKWYTVD